MAANNWLIFTPKKASAGDGYAVFSHEAKIFAEAHGNCPIVEIGANKMSGVVPLKEKRAETLHRRNQVLAAIFEHRPANVAFFCHGWRTGMQLGFDTASAGELAFSISESVRSTECSIALYSCSCGAGKLDTKYIAAKAETGDGGFADELRDAMCKRGVVHCRVDSHATVGHATSNPYVRRFEGNGSAIGGTGGNWIVAPGSALWMKWSKTLRSASNLRMRYPSMTTAEIHEELLRP